MGLATLDFTIVSSELRGDCAQYRGEVLDKEDIGVGYENMSDKGLCISILRNGGGYEMVSRPNFSNYQLLLLLTLTPLVAGWATRFILAGHKSPLPWVANKEAI
jgi:hypothetical protein